MGKNTTFDDTTQTLAPIITPAELAADINARAGSSSSEPTFSPVQNDVLQDILHLIKKPIDFRAKLELDEEEKPKQKQIVVVIIDELLDIARRANLGLAVQFDFVYIFTGRYWAQVDRAEFKSFLGEAAARLSSSSQRLECRHYKFRNELLNQFVNIANMPPPEPSDAVTLVNLQNGTLEITPTGYTLREHRQADFITYCLPFDYGERAAAPTFSRFLEQVQPDATARALLAEYVGSVFTTNKVFRFEKILFLYGTGANGKSVFFDTINALLGKQNVTNYNLKSLGEEHNRAQIHNKLLNYGSEIGGSILADLLKTMASREPMQMRLKYGNSFISDRYARLIFNCNELPKEVEHTEGFFRRFLILPFDVTIPEQDRDLDLANKIIKAELPGVLNWVLEGLKRVLETKKFTRCTASEEAGSEYRADSDSVIQFLKDEGLEASSEDFEPLTFMFAEYRRFCIDSGYRAVSKKNFRKRLEATGISSARRSSGFVVYVVKKTGQASAAA